MHGGDDERQSDPLDVDGHLWADQQVQGTRKPEQTVPSDAEV